MNHPNITDAEQLRRLLAEAADMQRAYRAGQFDCHNLDRFHDWLCAELEALGAVYSG